MLEALCGNKNVQRILLFLFVNGKCYGTQLQRILKAPLTPLQNGLMRLERGGIIMSYFEGKTKLYQFNPAYPMLPELESLLKKAFTLLAPHEKKQYYDLIRDNPSGSNQYENQKILLSFWEKLVSVTHLTFHAKTKSRGEFGWNGKGKGEVIVTKEGQNTLIFSEKGSWRDQEGKEIDFSNVFRWVLDLKTCMISLEHLRRGINHPVFLFHLAPKDTHSLASVDSHLCDGDIYLGQIFFDRHSLRLNWRVIGPKKNEEMDYFYG